MEPTQQDALPSSKPHKSPILHENPAWTTSHFFPHNQLPWQTSYKNPQQQQHPSMFLSHKHPAGAAPLNFNLNQDDDEDLDDQAPTHENPENDSPKEDQLLVDADDKEPMFEKPLTPSDVGKLNRLVIPKQYAEKYFPLGGESGDKGLLLSFEDESGKCWRFRYSYWNSSQSYVLTKGWSRYVKEKQLDAGDIILFERHRTDIERLFIGWRRRGMAAAAQDGGAAVIASGGVNDGWSRGLYHVQAHHPYLGQVQSQGANVPYKPDCLHAAPTVQHQTAAAPGNSKRLLRLFGVNMECQLDESEPSTPDSLPLSSQGAAAHPQFYAQSYSSTHMDITFSRDINQMRDRRG